MTEPEQQLSQWKVWTDQQVYFFGCLSLAMLYRLQSIILVDLFGLADLQSPWVTQASIEEKFMIVSR